VVEGPSDEKVVKELAVRLGETGVETRLVRGQNPRKTVSLARFLEGRGCHKILLVRDTHCRDPAKTMENFSVELKQNGLNARLAGKTRICIIASAVESWLLADEAAIGDYLGVDAEPIDNPETIHNPDEVLDEVFKRNRTYNRGYLKGGIDPMELAKRLNVQKLREKCAYFRHFEEMIRDP